MRTYLLGDKEINFQFLSDQKVNFPSEGAANFEDPNYNVAIPLFTIHGNHDDIGGTGHLSSMDILSKAGLINYFGKWNDLSEVEISPIILEKNASKLALYGLSHIHDKRLARLFRDHKVKVLKPDIDDKDIFNVMVLHQNRADRGRFNFIPEDKLPGFLDLVVWGHEHDCRIEPEMNGRTETFITQPGSSVATSLSEGESIEKKIGILKICKKDFNMMALKLKTVRPFIFRTINIEDFVEELRLNVGDTKAKVEKFYEQNVNEMIAEAKGRLTGHPKQPTLPLIRLRVMYINELHAINQTRFGQKFDKQVANLDTVVTFKKTVQRTKTSAYKPDDEALKSAFDKKMQQDRVEDVVENYFNELTDDKDKLKMLSLKSLSEVCRLLVDRDDDQAAENILQMHYDKLLQFMDEKMCHEEDIAEALLEFHTTKAKEVFNEGIVANSRLRPLGTLASNGNGHADDPAGSSSSTAKTTKAKGPAAPTTRRGKNSPAVSSPAGLDIKKTKGKQPTLAQTTQRSQASNASKRGNTLYESDSDSP